MGFLGNVGQKLLSGIKNVVPKIAQKIIPKAQEILKNVVGPNIKSLFEGIKKSSPALSNLPVIGKFVSKLIDKNLPKAMQAAAKLEGNLTQLMKQLQESINKRFPATMPGGVTITPPSIGGESPRGSATNVALATGAAVAAAAAVGAATSSSAPATASSTSAATADVTAPAAGGAAATTTTVPVATPATTAATTAVASTTPAAAANAVPTTDEIAKLTSRLKDMGLSDDDIKDMQLSTKDGASQARQMLIQHKMQTMTRAFTLASNLMQMYNDAMRQLIGNLR